MLCQHSLGCVPILLTARGSCFVSTLGVLGLQPVTQGAWIFCTSSLTSHRNFDTRTMYLTSRFLVPDLYLRLVTRVLGLASRPEGLSSVKAMKTEVCAWKLGSGQTIRHTESGFWRHRRIFPCRVATITRFRYHHHEVRPASLTEYRMRRGMSRTLHFAIRGASTDPHAIVVLTVSTGCLLFTSPSHTCLEALLAKALG